MAIKKVLISMLGTGIPAKDDANSGYEKTDYSIDGQIYKDNTLVALPLIEHLQIDALYLIGTKSSMWDNIADSFENSEEQSSMKIFFNRFFKNKSAYSKTLLEKISKAKAGEKEGCLTEEDLQELNELINSKLKSQNSHCFLVEDAQNEDELWTMFEKFLEIFKTLNEDDEVELYLDITHAFRSIAMFSVIMAQFSKIKLNSKVAGIYYGQLIKDKSQASPVLNLSIFFEILDWAQAIKIFKHYGSANELLKLMDKDFENGDLRKAFKNFSASLSLSDLTAIQSSLKKVKANLAYFREHNKILVNSLAEELVEFLDFFDGIEDEYIAQFQFRFSQWYAQSENYAMAYITLQEAIISALCENDNKSSKDKDYLDYRNTVKGRFKDPNSEIMLNKRQDEDAKKYYREITDIRNDIAHKNPNFDDKRFTSAKVVERFKLYSDFFAPLFS